MLIITCDQIKDLRKKGSGFATQYLYSSDAAMARPLGIKLIGAVYHITSRGNARSRFLDQSDWDGFLDILSMGFYYFAPY